MDVGLYGSVSYVLDSVKSMYIKCLKSYREFYQLTLKINKPTTLRQTLEVTLENITPTFEDDDYIGLTPTPIIKK